MIKFTQDVFKHNEDFIQTTPDSINKGVIDNGVRAPINNAMFVDDNLITDTQEYLRLALATSIKALFILLGHPKGT